MHYIVICVQKSYYVFDFLNLSKEIISVSTGIYLISKLHDFNNTASAASVVEKNFED